MTRMTPFSSPLLLGFDAVEKTLERLAKNGDSYPPYNIERIRSADGAAYALRFGDVTVRAGGQTNSTSTTIDGLRPNESITGVPQGAGNRVRISATAEPGP